MDFAKSIGVHHSQFSRMLGGKTPVRPTIGTCLRIAQLTGASASKILRAAEYGGIAEMIEELYGAPAARQAARRAALGLPSPSEQRLLHVYRQLRPTDRKFFLRMMERLSEPGRIVSINEWTNGS